FDFKFSLLHTVTPTSEFYTLSLHDALPISTRAARRQSLRPARQARRLEARGSEQRVRAARDQPRPSAERRELDAAPRCRRPLQRSEEHTSELQSRRDLVCRLLLEKKKI